MAQQIAAIWRSILGLIFTLATSHDKLYSTILPPDGNDPILSFVGRGVQIYQCSSSNGSSNYVLQGAEAELFSYTLNDVELKTVKFKRRWGYHYFLPYPDGEGGKPTFSMLASPTDDESSTPSSTATFKLISSVASANPKDIPSLLLRATSHSGNGLLSMVSYAQRINTLGGVAPKGQSCGKEGESVRVPYRAQYRFWSQSQIPPAHMPASIMVPQGHALLASFFGLGFQIYRYNGSEWILINASATLSSLPGTPAMGRHYFLQGPAEHEQAQPTWEFFSPRGQVSAKLIQKFQKTPEDIPWLLAQMTSYIGKQSIAARVAYVQRLSTVGGVAPPARTSIRSNMRGAKSGDIYQSAYSAIYSFFGS